MNHKTIYLIGLPGSGKTTIGKGLSEQMNLNFIDLDHEIERQSHMYIEEIFSKHGEKTFRQWEHDVLKEVANQHAIVSCGGGVVTNSLNYDIMKQGRVIHLMADHQVLSKRLENSYARPILNKKTMEQLAEERFLSYQKFADVNINAEREIEVVIESILNYLSEDKQ
jgi:shikimate kinase